MPSQPSHWCGGVVPRPASSVLQGCPAWLLPDLFQWHQHHSAQQVCSDILVPNSGAQWLEQHTPVPRCVLTPWQGLWFKSPLPSPWGGEFILSRLQRMSHHQQPMGEEKKKRRKGKGNRKEPVEAPHWCTWSGDQIPPSHWPNQTKPIGW